MTDEELESILEAWIKLGRKQVEDRFIPIKELESWGGATPTCNVTITTSMDTLLDLLKTFKRLRMERWRR